MNDAIRAKPIKAIRIDPMRRGGGKDRDKDSMRRVATFHKLRNCGHSAAQRHQL